MTELLAAPVRSVASTGTPTLAVTGLGVACRGARGPADADRDDPAVEGWFDVRTELGTRGYKYLPPACQQLVAASRRALAEAGEVAADPERRAAAVGTNSAAAALHDAMDRTVIAGDANDLSPATAPFFSINLFGSRLATEHGLKAFNLTLTTPLVAGLEALELGGRSVALGRADVLLAGAAEAAPPAGEGGAGEEGAVVVVAEPLDVAVARGAAIQGTCRVRSLFLPPSRLGTSEGAASAVDAVAAVLDDLTGDGGPLQARAVVDGSAAGAALVAALERAGAEVTVHPAGAGALAPLRHVAAVLAAGDGDHVVAAATAEGHVALAYLRPARTAPPARSPETT